MRRYPTVRYPTVSLVKHDIWFVFLVIMSHCRMYQVTCLFGCWNTSLFLLNDIDTIFLMIAANVNSKLTLIHIVYATHVKCHRYLGWLLCKQTFLAFVCGSLTTCTYINHIAILWYVIRHINLYWTCLTPSSYSFKLNKSYLSSECWFLDYASNCLPFSVSWKARSGEGN